ncbi:hypothetical protein [Rhizohabitans arisaemae]|uniref:hypothetical protein n=1 Tax=Rhizohabitans arisaemae TaxID=2720610 RepID=UPI0024B0DAFF|nr:hypothetical protein [Rhizohabitans arisaemae]
MEDPDSPNQGRARRLLVAVLVAVFVAMVLYRVLHDRGLEQTALFYIGLPAVIAITVVLTARPKNATGLIMAAITVGLALAGPLLSEGSVCLFFSAPLFYLVGLLFGLIFDAIARNRGRGPHAFIVPVALLALIEGGMAVAAPPQTAEVSVTRPAGPGDVGRALTETPDFSAFESPFLKLGFPRPLRAEGTGLAVGALRTITFTPRKSLGIGAVAEPRAMTLRVREHTPGRVVFAVVDDTTLARWVELREAEFAWDEAELTVTLRYRRTFDPAWYFGPLQRYAMTEAADYLAATFTR